MFTSYSRLVEVEAWGGAGAATGAGTDIRWLVSDQLGTPRMVVDQTGSLAGMTRHDYLPFGEEIGAGTGGRATTQGYGAADNVRQKFTKKERDGETNLDYFEARYYSSAMGRFISPDEFKGGPNELYYFVSDASLNPTFYADLAIPQSLNKYQYTYNNPLRYTDPNGHCPWCPVVEEVAESPVGQWISQNVDKIITVTGVAATTAVVAASGVGKDFLKYASEHPAKSAAMQDMEDLRMLRPQPIRSQDNSGNQGNNNQPSQSGQQQSNTPQSTGHDQQKKQEGRSGQDPRRDVGDANRVIREGKQYVDSETGNLVYVGKKGHTVITDPSGERIITRNTYTNKQIQSRRDSGKWEEPQ